MNRKIVGIFVCTLLITSALPVMGANRLNYKIENQEIILDNYHAGKTEKGSDDEYTIIDLGTLGGIWSYAGGLNNQCYVVGISSIYSGAQHAFVWMCDMMTDIGTPEGFVVSGAVNVNDNGQVAGYANGAYQSQYAYLWEDGNWTYLGTIPDLDYSAPYDINNPGQIVGHSFMLGPGGGSLAWIYEDGYMTELGTLGGGRSSAFGINDEGQVVGVSRTSDNSTHAFLWQDGVMTDLGVLPDEENSAAYDINENGQICGASSHTLNQYPFPTYVTACFWDGDEIIEIGKLPGYTRNSAAGGINDQGQVVGYSSDNGNNPHAFIWEDEVITDLNSLIPSGSGWELKGAADINNKGEIVGYGKYNGETHGYLLIPPYINQQPEFSNEAPANGSKNIPLTMTSLNITIEDIEGDNFNWSIETSPNIGSNSGNDENNGTKTCSISGLSYETTYTWYVNSTDTGSGKWTKEIYTFTTQGLNNPPMKPIIFEDNKTLFIYTMDPEDDDVKYIVDWDDGTTTETDWYSSGQIIEISHEWSEPGTYDIRAKATDIYGAESDWSNPYTIVIENRPPDIPTIDGPPKGEPKVEYTYCINVTDPDNDDLYVLWNWDDGTTTDWVGPYTSGTQICASHTWNETGTYIISVTVKDEDGNNATATKEVIIPRSRTVFYQFLQRLSERFPMSFSILKQILKILFYGR